MAVTFDGGVVRIRDTDSPRLQRHPSDFLRLILSVVATGLGFLLATTFVDLSHVIAVEVVQTFGYLPDWSIILAAVGSSLVGFLLPFLLLGYLVRHREWRRLGVALAAVVIALSTLWLIDSLAISRFTPSSLEFAPPSWLCEPASEGAAGIGVPSCVGTERVDSPVERYGFPVAMTAFFAAIYPYLNRRWQRFGWVGVASAAMIGMLTSIDPPTDQILAIALAFAAGTGMLLLLGMPDRRPGPDLVVDALKRSGVELDVLRRAQVDARGSVPFIGATVDGDGLFVKVLTPEERAADTLFRWFRIFRFKGIGDERPFPSIRRAAEHEAVMSLKAASDGIRTPRLVAVAEIEPASMALAFELLEGQSLDSTPAEVLSDDVLRGIWELVRELRETRTAHRDLRLANVFLGKDDVPWLIDFSFAELAATDGQLRSDLAELVTATALIVGTERAVRCAIDVVGAEVLANAASRVQPLALSGATRSAVKKQKSLISEVRSEIARQTRIEVPEPENLVRVKPKTALMVAGFALAMYFLIPQLTETDFSVVSRANWTWVPAILVASLLTYVGAALNIMGSVPDKIRLIPSFLAQMAGSFINRISPVKVGGMATNVRYLQQNGIDLTAALAGLGVSNVATFAVHLSLLSITVAWLGRSAGDFLSVPSGATLLLGLVGFFTLSTALFALPASRRLVQSKVWPAIRKSGQGLAEIARSPSKAMMLFGGALLMIVSYIAALWFSLEAFGSGLGVAAVALAFLGGQALGNLAPTPGGIGAAEAALIAALTALGLDATTAVAATFLYRIATFWLPILPGVFSFRKLQREQCL